MKGTVTCKTALIFRLKWLLG